MHMVVAFERGRLVCEVGGGGPLGLTPDQATYFAHDMRGEFPDALVAIVPARPSWEGGWPWSSVLDGTEGKETRSPRRLAGA